MSQEIEVHRIDKFSEDIMQLAQQRGSVFMGQTGGFGMAAVDIDMNVQGKRKFYNQLAATAATEITTRHADTAITDTPHRRRMVSMRRWAKADLIDEHDLVRIAKDPSAEYAEAFGWAIGRAIDDAVIASFFATAATGEDGTGTSAHPASHQIAAGAAGMAISKLRQAREILEGSEEAEDEDNRWYIAMSARQRRDLLASTEVTSSDFNSVKALVSGQINQFLGLTFLKTQRLGLVGAERAVPVWTRRSMKLAFNQSMVGSIDTRPDKNHSKQIFFRADFGSTRMNETGVVRILCTET